MDKPTVAYWCLWGAVWGLSLGLRLWGLGRFEELVFDEVYFAKFAWNYLQNMPFFDGHPPLGKYIIALGIKLTGFYPWGYRWLNAWVGSWIPVLTGLVTYELSRQRWLALIAGYLVAMDGLLLVESRYALINVHLIALGLLGQWLILRRSLLAGVFLGASVAVKWNALAYWLGGILTALKLRWRTGRVIVGLTLIPGAVYLLLWLPHLAQNTDMDLFTLHRQMLGVHTRLGSGPEVHPYCSTWWSWPLLLRPMSYYYQNQGGIITSVQAMGNPWLWWLVLAAVLASLPQFFRKNCPWELQFALGNYWLNLLPWALVKRCIFIYHYLPALVFGCMALAWWVVTLWQRGGRGWAAVALLLPGVGLAFWLPIYLGLPLTLTQWRWRFWFPGWI
ncbi:MAG: phospholipid carrier-dependent glycosyltransferase [Gloeomargarita sp. DG02_4_bins_56]